MEIFVFFSTFIFYFCELAADERETTSIDLCPLMLSLSLFALEQMSLCLMISSTEKFRSFRRARAEVGSLPYVNWRCRSIAGLAGFSFRSNRSF